jgi:hypothetical protein
LGQIAKVVVVSMIGIEIALAVYVARSESALASLLLLIVGIPVLLIGALFLLADTGRRYRRWRAR